MMKILVCDDNKLYLNKIEYIINEWKASKGIELDLFCTANIKDALRVTGFSEYQIAFIDVEMPEMSGLDMAERLRDINPDIIIIIISNYTNYVYDAFSLQVYSYIYKDDMDIRIPDIMNKVIVELKDVHSMFRYKIHREEYMINTRRIKYFQVNLHHMDMYIDNEVIEFVDSMKEIENRLDKEIFVRINRKNIVNVRYIEEIRGKEVILTGNVRLPVGEKYLDNVKIKRLQWYGNK